jgi:hypothetical protein
MTRRSLCVLLAAIAMGCDHESDTVTGPTALTITTRTFTGSLAVGASRFYSFAVSSGGTITASLASVTSDRDGLPLDTILELGIGFPAGTGCAVTATKNVSAGLTAQLLSSATGGVHCVRVADVGDMTAPVKFAVRFSHP